MHTPPERWGSTVWGAASGDLEMATKDVCRTQRRRSSFTAFIVIRFLEAHESPQHAIQPGKAAGAKSADPERRHSLARLDSKAAAGPARTMQPAHLGQASLRALLEFLLFLHRHHHSPKSPTSELVNSVSAQLAVKVIGSPVLHSTPTVSCIARAYRRARRASLTGATEQPST